MTGESDESDSGKPRAAPAETPGRQGFDDDIPARKLRLYFDLTDGDTTLRDDEGVEVADLEHAVAEARAVLRELQDHEEGWFLVIRDADGAECARLPVR